MNDDARAENADSREQPLDNTARRIGQTARFQSYWIGEQDDRCSGQTHQALGAKTKGISMQVAVKADNPGRDRRDSEP